MSSRPRVLLSRRWPAPVEARLEELFEVSFNRRDIALSAAEMRAALESFDAFCPTVTDKVNAEVFASDRLQAKLIANYGVGFNHIDLEVARARGIAVSNTPDVLTDCTADLAMTLMLMAARRAGEGERHVRNGQWQGWYPTHMMGTKVTGKTLAIVGMGRIGQAMAQKAHHGFGMKIIYHNRQPIPEQQAAALEAVYMEDLDAMIPQADFLALHCPSVPETRHLMDARRLGLMKPGAFLVNSARGDVVDELALIKALQDKVIAGAALDVYEQEPSVPEALKAMENVVLLPHLGSATQETRIAMGMRVVENLEAFFSGKALPDQVA